jgi:hypothetical protein
VDAADRCGVVFRGFANFREPSLKNSFHVSYPCGRLW